MTIYLRDGSIVKYNDTQDKALKKLYGNLFGRSLLKVLVHPNVSKLGGMYMNSPLSKKSIQSFIKNNNINMDDYEDKEYTSYNDFFTRKIKEGKRKFEDDPNILCSPCDSKVSYYKINEDTQILIKDTYYSLDDLLLSPHLTSEYRGGDCLVLRLTVDDYHHYHYFDDGISEEERIIPGEFHTVNPIANDYYPIYKRNTRHYTKLLTKHFDDVIYMEVGALMVGKIVNLNKKKFIKGEEKGYFEFGGSTIVLLFKKDIVKIDDDIIEHSKNYDEVKVRLGEKIGTRL